LTRPPEHCEYRGANAPCATAGSQQDQAEQERRSQIADVPAVGIGVVQDDEHAAIDDQRCLFAEPIAKRGQEKRAIQDFLVQRSDSDHAEQVANIRRRSDRLVPRHVW
jgi:hypothetical protein